MASSLVLTIKSDKTQAVNQTAFQLNANKGKEAMLALSQLFKELASRNHRGVVDIQTGSAAPVAASATFTLVSVVATDTVTIGPTTFTFTSDPSLETDVEVDGATDADDATALAAAINAHSTVGQVVTAEAASNVVTVTAKQKGVVGNFINFSSGDATITASGANLSGGTGGVTEAATSFERGIA